MKPACRTENSARRGIVLLFLTAILCASTVIASTDNPAMFQASAERAQQRLEAGKLTDRKIGEGEMHVFVLSLEAGEFTHVFINQQGVNVAASLIGPDSKKLVEADSPLSTQEAEWISHIAAATGEYKIEVRAVGKGAAAGRYEIKVEEQHRATAEDEKRVAAETAFVDGMRLTAEGQEASARKAIEKYKEALSLYRALGRRIEEAVTLNCLGRIYALIGENQTTIEYYTQALVIYRGLKDRHGEGFTLNWLGNAQSRDQYKKAIEYYELALAARREVKYRAGEGATLNNLGNLYNDLRQPEKATNYLQQSLLIVREAKDRNLERVVLYNLARVFLSIEKYGEAIGYLEQTLALIRVFKDRAGEGNILFDLGSAYYSEKKYEKAVEHYEQAVAVNREMRNRANEGRALNNLGNAYGALGQQDAKAIECYNQALIIYREVRDRENERITLSNLGNTYKRLKQDKEAVKHYELALNIVREIKDREGEKSLLAAIAEVCFEQKDYDKAISFYQEYLTIGQSSEQRDKRIYVLRRIAEAYWVSSRFEQALTYYNQVLPLVRESKDRQAESFTLFLIGSCYLNLNRSLESMQYFNEYLPLARELNDRPNEALALLNIGYAYARLFQYDETIKYYEKSISIFRALGDRKQEIQILGYTAMLFEIRGLHDQALDYLSRAIDLIGKTEDRFHESQTLVMMGNIYDRQALFDQSLNLYFKALKVSREINNRDLAAEGDALLAIANVYTMMGGQSELALKNYNDALAIFRELKNPNSEAGVMVGVGNVYLETSRYQEAIGNYEKGLQISRGLNDYFNQISALIGLGYCYERLSNSEQALKYLNQAMSLAKKVGDHYSESVVYLNIGYVYYRLGQYELSLTNFNQSLALARKGNHRYAEARSLSYMGDIYVRMERFEDALATLDKAIIATRQSMDRVAEGRTLIFSGNAYLGLKQSDRALSFYEKAIDIAHEVSEQADEGLALSKMQEAWQQQNRPRLAIFYGKQAVNIYQAIRGNIKTLDKETQRSFLKDKESAYRTLANLLISEGRLPEAEQVLNLLKAEEYSQITRRDGPKRAELGFDKAEQSAAEVNNRLATLGASRGQLLGRLKHAGLGEVEKSQLNAQVNAIDKQMRETSELIRHLLAEIEKQKADTSGLDRTTQAFMRDLRDLGQGTVALYTLVSKDGGWIILITPDFRKAYSINVNGLEQAVLKFREVLKTDQYDPLPLAQKLYRMLMTHAQQTGPTLADDLKTYGAKTLMWSLDSVLRYVPISALHDGEKYLVERFRNVVITTESLPRLKDGMSKHWKGLGLGVSKAHAGFNPLAGVPRELQAIIREPGKNNSIGVLPGVVKLDESFTEKAMIEGLREGYPVVHIASHYSYDAARADLSFLLLGDGSHLTLEKMKDMISIFEGVDLLTLSACDTATSPLTANGKDVEGLAYLAQNLGAKAVVASLWPVADIGTEKLMREFYKIRSASKGISKAEAFQRAQLILLHGNDPGAGTKNEQRSAKVNKDNSGAAFPPNQQARFSHPHYWAPFILIGNAR